MSVAPPPSADCYSLLSGAGPAAIASIRVRGPGLAALLAGHLKPAGRRPLVPMQDGAVRYAELHDAGDPLDDVVLFLTRSRGDWEAHIHLHGSPGVIERCCELLERAGFQRDDAAAESLWPAETHLHAEAYALLPEMLTLHGARWLLAQADLLAGEAHSLQATSDLPAARRRCEQLLARAPLVDWFRCPLRVALVGPPNAGKSTLANALAGGAVSIVSDRPGTTRDWVEVPGEVTGFPVLWIDTAGLRAADEPLEQEGIRRSLELLDAETHCLLVLDGSDPDTAGTIQNLPWDRLRPLAVALNKADRDEAPRQVPAAIPAAFRPRASPSSARRGDGVAELAERVVAAAGRSESILADTAPFRPRQVRILQSAAAAESPKVLSELMLELLWGAASSPP